MKEWRTLAAFLAVFGIAYFLPLGDARVKGALLEAFKMLQWYARNHMLACVVPALFIAGAITTFLSKEAVLRHLGPRAGKVRAYAVASVGGTVLAVCSCSVLPMFAGIYQVGAGLGPASAFLYSGPAINVLALFLTARVLGLELGLARAIGAIVFGVIIGIVMALVFRRSEDARTRAMMALPPPKPPRRPAWKTGLFVTTLVAFLVCSDWYNPGHVTVTRVDGAVLEGVVLQETADQLTVQLNQPGSTGKPGDKVAVPKASIASLTDAGGWVMTIWHAKWALAGFMGLLVLLMTWRWIERDERRAWMQNTWDFAKMLVPLLFGGVFVVGFLGALLPEDQVAALVGDNSLQANLFASVVGCLFYFATLTEIPILEALMRNGMAPGPALALLLAGPALSLPSLLVIRSVIGLKKTAVFTVLVVLMATLVGVIYGALAPGG